MRLSALVAGIVAAAVVVGLQAPVAFAQTQNNNQTEEKIIVEVKPGDYLDRIARKNSTTYHRLYDANLQIKDPDLIYPGDKIRIPHPDEQLEKRELPKDAPVRVAEPTKPAPAPEPKKKTSSTTTTQRRTNPQPAPQPTGAISTSVWDRLAQCESGGNWSINTGNGYYGGLQFSLSSWRAVGGSGYPHQASKSEQIARAERLQTIQGWGAWPACTAKLGIR